MASSPKSPPNFIWRLSKYEDLSGRGGLRASGRWHTRPKMLLYCCEEPHTAYLEMLRYFSDEMLFPDSLKALKIRVPQRLEITEIDENDLDPLWSDRVAGYGICQPLGDDWITGIRTPLLRVPSAVGGGRYNILVNSAHPDAADLQLEEVIRQPFPELIRMAS